MSLPLIIFGAGSLAKLVYHLATSELELNVLAFAVDEFAKTSNQMLGIPIISRNELENTYSPQEVLLFSAIGYKSMRQRARVTNHLMSKGWQMTTLVSPAANVAKSAKLGKNCIVMAGTVIEPEAKLLDNNIIWSNSTVCHESSIGSDNFFASNSTIGGEVTIGDQCFFGFSSTVLQRRVIGDNVLIGASSLLTKNALSNGCYIGVPAKRVKEIPLDEGIKVF